jgi:hypothetical protein
MCLLYISIHGLKSHIEQTDSTTLLIPLGYVLFSARAIKELVDLDLIENETSMELTEKGVRYIIEYKRVLVFMKRMGLSYR